MRRVLEEFPAAAAAMQDAMADELTRLTEGLERVRQQLLAIDGDTPPRSSRTRRKGFDPLTPP